MPMAEIIIFYTIAALMVFCGLMVITRRNPISSAVYLVVTLFLVAAIYAFLGADFVAAVQILVYAGAIMVLFLFVIMLLNLDPESLRGPSIPVGEMVVMVITAIAFLGVSVMLFLTRAPDAPLGFASDAVISETGGNTHVLGTVLFVNYFWPFQLVGFLILMAIIASILIARREKKELADVKGIEGHD